MEDEYNHVSEELVYCLTNVPGPGLVGGIPADLGGCLCTTTCSIGCSHLLNSSSSNYTPDGLLIKGAGSNLPIYECNSEVETQIFRFQVTLGAGLLYCMWD